ncbi:MAG TPA: glycine dehydrogenase, partial [Ilumatobacteraceae bacterium]|nr:glycine dehydrogenase [Ilumatobacteraceae bacterium]
MPTHAHSPATPPKPPAGRADLASLLERDEFVRRHIGPDTAERERMLAAIGVGSLAELIDATVPRSIRTEEPLGVGPGATVEEALGELRQLADKNALRTSLIGMGYYNPLTPPVVQRNVIENPAWYTAYTPYQPEISQGRLEALLNFQTMVAELLDEATAAAEAMTMIRRLTRHKTARFYVDHDTHPQTLTVLHTRAVPLGIELVVGPPSAYDSTCFGALVSWPASSGELGDHTALIEQVHADGGLVAAITDLLACVLMTPPGHAGADIAVGVSQRFGVPMGFGGPHAAFIATHEANARSLPGRLVGVSTDTAGRPALRLALQTREQHIRREKATSNICTAQVLLANIAGLYAAWHGPVGLTRIAERVHRLTSITVAGLRANGLEVLNDTWFDTVLVRVGDAERVHIAADVANLALRHIDRFTVGFS